MKLALSDFGTSLATREKAREVADSLRGATADVEVQIDFDGVTASPSFIAELLSRLSSHFLSMSVEGGSERVRSITRVLVEKLGLTGRVRELTAN